MLATIKDTLLGIGKFFSTIIDFVVGFINDTVNFIKQIPEAVEEITELANSFFPPEIALMLVGLLAILVILRVLGRD